MLSKTERKYLSAIEAFEDSSTDYAKAVRSRIRKKAEQALTDLILVVKNDQHGRQPAKEWRNRRNREVINTENPSEKDVAISNFRAMLNRTWRGKRQRSMITPIWILDFVHATAKKDSWLGERLIEVARNGRIEFRSEKRASLLRQYREEWQAYGKKWLRIYLSTHTGLCWDAGFKGEEDCLTWLNKSSHQPKT